MKFYDKLFHQNGQSISWNFQIVVKIMAVKIIHDAQQVRNLSDQVDTQANAGRNHAGVQSPSL